MADNEETGGIAGHHAKTREEIKAGINVDKQALSVFEKSIGAITKAVQGLRNEMQGLAKDSASVQAPGGQGAAKAQNGTPAFHSSSLPVGSGAATPTAGTPGGGVFGGLGSLGGGTKTALAGGAAAAYAGSKGLGTIDARIDTNRQYSIGADRLTVQSMMRTGLSQNEAMNQIRRPMDPYRLGVNGRNEIHDFSLRTGIDTAKLAPFASAMRAYSGGTMGTQDVLGIYQQNLDPATANRQFMMMGGMNAYGPGGEPRDPMKLMNSRMKMLGLDNAIYNKGARRQGSYQRARAQALGIGNDEFDMLLNMGETSSTFKKQNPGMGEFDMNNKEHREAMGIEDTFAMQSEETDRVRANREEDMYRRQADNYADLEKSNQQLIKVLGEVEDQLSALTGIRASSRPWQKSLGGLLGAVGVGGIVGGGLLGGGGLGGMLGGGDPPERPSSAGAAHSGVSSNSSSANDGNIKIPVGYNGGRKTLNEVKQRSDFQKMHPKMQQRMLAMFRENPNLGIGGGYRDSQVQEDMFLSRHEPTNEDTGIRWRGQNWKRVRGAAAAPPGRSMHEIGLAADLVGDLTWMNANAARFGLKHFAGVNNEPWHVQPIELPNSRRAYEEQGSAWGTNGDFDEDAVFTEVPGTGESQEHGSGGGAQYGLGGSGDFTGMSIQEIVDTYLSGGAVASSGGGWGTSSRGNTASGGGSSDGSGYGAGYADVGGAENFNGEVTSGAMAAAKAAFAAGFRGQDLATIVAIAGRESGWKSDAVNRNTSDRGMWQINWTANQEHAKAFGADDITDLLDVNLNAKVAKRLFDLSGWMPWRASDSSPYLDGAPGWDRNGDHLWHTERFQGEAAAAANTAMNSSGDPTDQVMHMARPRRAAAPSPVAGGGSGNLAMHNTYQIDFSPTIKIDSHGHTDMKALGAQVEAMLKESMNKAVERSA